MSGDSLTLAESDIHDILRNDRRRAVIEFLTDHDGRATIRDLSEHIAMLESDESPPPRNVRQSVYVSLHQTHLPKLDGLDVIGYDTDSKEVELRDQADQVRAYMGQSETYNTAVLIYLLIGILGVLSSLVSINVGSTAVPWTWITLLFVAVVLLSGYQLRQ